MGRRIWTLAAVTVLLLSLWPVPEAQGEGPQYYLGSLTNAGKDTGYAEVHEIGEKDPHFGWELGRFFVSGYTSIVEQEQPIFLKTAGDEVTLWFQLDQDIDCLNGQEGLIISQDKNGYDRYFGIQKADFGRGALIIRHIDHQNEPGEPVIYTDFLAARAAQGAATEVDLFEEGDYEVALDYEIREGDTGLLGKISVPGYTNYRIAFRFSVRNGNCMVFPFDAVTGQELINADSTENGFVLDLARSRYLDVYVKRELLMQDGESLQEDVRFNRPAKDGDQYTQEGIYTVTVHNRYTDQETCKVIYVGTDPCMKAHVATGLPLAEIHRRIDQGEQLGQDGRFLTDAPLQTDAEPQAEAEALRETDPAASSISRLPIRKIAVWAAATVGILVVLRIAWYLFIHRT